MFRSLGFAEIVIIIALVVLFMGGKRVSGLFTRAGNSVREARDKAKWLYNSLGGSEEEEIRDEEKVGKDMAERFLQECPMDKDGEAQALLSGVGSELVKGLGEQPRTFSFAVVDAPVVNAYALPGGHIFVTRPLLDLTRGDRDEVAFLLAHEMSHIMGRHAAEKYQVSAVLGAVRMGGLVRNLLDKGYSREQETESDSRAVGLMSKAGFSPEGAVRALRKLQSAGPERPEFAQYFSTHPETADRIVAVQRRSSEA